MSFCLEKIEVYKDYLIWFLNEYDYEKDDSLVLVNHYDQIVSDSALSKILFDTISLYEQDYNCDFDTIISNADQIALISNLNEYTVEFLVSVLLTKRLKELFILKGYPIDYFNKTVLHLKYKLNECKDIYGIVGSFVVHWFAKIYRLIMISMGRLQFEVMPFGEHYEKNGVILTPTTPVINVHIPHSGEPLSEKACEDSYLLAKEFFKDQLTLNPCPFVCDSYLLYPENEKFLPKTGNVYRFFKSFDVFSSKVDKHRDNLWRLFDTHEKNLDKLPNDSSLRRAFIEHLKNGGKLGTGRGVLFF